MTVRLGFILGALLPLVFVAPGASAGEQSERAIAAVNAMRAAGEFGRAQSIKVAFKSGNIAALLGPGDRKSVV